MKKTPKVGSVSNCWGAVQPAQYRTYPTIAVAAAMELEDIVDGTTRADMLVSDKQSCAVIKVLAFHGYRNLTTE